MPTDLNSHDKYIIFSSCADLDEKGFKWIERLEKEWNKEYNSNKRLNPLVKKILENHWLRRVWIDIWTKSKINKWKKSELKELSA